MTRELVLSQLLEIELELDRRDDVFNPRRGFRSSLGLKWASSFFGSDVEYLGGSL